MEFFRRNPIFYTSLFSLLGACLVGIWYLAQLSGTLSALKRSYETKSAQYLRYVEARPSPTRSNLEVIEENYRDLYEVFEQTMRVLNLNTYDRRSFFGNTPESRADWSFELHKFKENARYAALSNSVELPPNVHFGFEDLADGGPTPENMRSVHEQVMIMSSLLETLFNSGIDSFVRIQRGEKPDSRGAGAIARRSGDRLLNDGERFVLAPDSSLAIPGVIESHAFRVAFRGQSIGLRRFLNQLANSSLPFAIRGVEVDLSSEGGEKLGLESRAASSLARGERSGSVPIISENRSLFVVTLEFFNLAVEIEPPPVRESEGERDV